MKSCFSKRRVASSFALALILAGVSVGCSSPKVAASSDIRRDLLEGLGTQVWVPTYAAFVTAATDLDGAVAQLCSSPSVDTLEAARSAWWSSRAPWKRNELLSFGPVVDAPLRAGPKIDFWPARADTIEALLDSTTALSAEALDSRGASERGLPVIEYLLYVLPEADGAGGAGGAGGAAPSGSTAVDDVFAKDSRRCEYLTALTGDLIVQAQALHDAWDPKHGNYLANLADAGRDKQFTSVEMALGEVVSRLAFMVDNIRSQKLGAPLGTKTDGTPQPDSAESRFSARSLEDARDNLRGVEATIFGATGKNKVSIADYLETIEQGALVPKLEDAFKASYSALDAIDDPLTATVLTEVPAITAAIDELSKLQVLIQVDMIQAMGITLTFNDHDAD